VVALIGPRQCGKTTLAREFVNINKLNYFDLEDPRSLIRLSEPMTALDSLEGLVVIDEVQRKEELFPILRVLADRKPLPARFLVLGSASPELLRQSSETLAGRLETIVMGGLDLKELGPSALDRHWLRGAFPPSYLARSETDSLAWRRQFISTIFREGFSATWCLHSISGSLSLLGNAGLCAWKYLEGVRSGPFTGRKSAYCQEISRSSHGTLYGASTSTLA